MGKTKKAFQVFLNPMEVRYTNKTISAKFGDGRTVDSTITEIENGQCDVNDIPTIKVVQNLRDGTWWSLNNRRLYVFRSLYSTGHLAAIPCLNVTKTTVFQRRWETLESKGERVRVRPSHAHVRTECYHGKKSCCHGNESRSRNVCDIVVDRLKNINRISSALSELTNHIETQKRILRRTVGKKREPPTAGTTSRLWRFSEHEKYNLQISVNVKGSSSRSHHPSDGESRSPREKENPVPKIFVTIA